MKIKMRVATQSLISAQVANGGGAPVVELLLCQQRGFCQNPSVFKLIMIISLLLSISILFTVV